MVLKSHFEPQLMYRNYVGSGSSWGISYEPDTIIKPYPVHLSKLVLLLLKHTLIICQTMIANSQNEVLLILANSTKETVEWAEYANYYSDREKGLRKTVFKHLL